MPYVRLLIDVLFAARRDWLRGVDRDAIEAMLDVPWIRFALAMAGVEEFSAETWLAFLSAPEVVDALPGFCTSDEARRLGAPSMVYSHAHVTVRDGRRRSLFIREAVTAGVR